MAESWSASVRGNPAQSGACWWVGGKPSRSRRPEREAGFSASLRAGDGARWASGVFRPSPLAEAREKARKHRTLAEEGVDPVAARQANRSAVSAEQQAQRTFSEVAAQYLARHEKSWKNAKHQAQWAATLRTYVEPTIGKMLVRDVRPAHVIGLLEPIWTTKTETATRVRSRIELVLDYATAHGFREGLNPARWKGNLDAALPNASKVTPVRHHAAVEVKEVASFMKRLRLQDGVGARALEFAVLTAARSEAAYRRGDLLEKRIDQMTDWASFLAGSRNSARNGA